MENATSYKYMVQSCRNMIRIVSECVGNSILVPKQNSLNDFSKCLLHFIYYFGDLCMEVWCVIYVFHSAHCQWKSEDKFRSQFTHSATMWVSKNWSLVLRLGSKGRGALSCWTIFTTHGFIFIKLKSANQTAFFKSNIPTIQYKYRSTWYLYIDEWHQENVIISTNYVFCKSRNVWTRWW